MNDLTVFFCYLIYSIYIEVFSKEIIWNIQRRRGNKYEGKLFEMPK